jgi:hypothetical protein
MISGVFLVPIMGGSFYTRSADRDPAFLSANQSCLVLIAGIFLTMCAYKLVLPGTKGRPANFFLRLIPTRRK